MLDIGEIVTTVGTSEAYRAARNDPDNERLNELDRRRRSIRLAATALQERKPSGYLTPEGHAMNITAQLTTFSQSLDELNDLREQGAKHHEKLRPLRKVAEFNHAVKDMIDNNPSLQFTEVLNFIMNMNQQINGNPEHGHAFEDQVRGILVGMRHEIAFEQMLGYMPDVEYREATIEEDLQGADIFVSLNNSPMVPIDVKAGAEKTQVSKEQAHNRGYDSSHIIWSHILDEDFNGSFRISNDVAAAKAGYVYNDLRNTVFQQSYSRQQSA